MMLLSGLSRQQLGSFMSLTSVSPDQRLYLLPESEARASDVDQSVHGVAAVPKMRGRLYQSIDVGAEVEDGWKDVDIASSEDREQVGILVRESWSSKLWFKVLSKGRYGSSVGCR